MQVNVSFNTAVVYLYRTTYARPFVSVHENHAIGSMD